MNVVLETAADLQSLLNQIALFFYERLRIESLFAM